MLKSDKNSSNKLHSYLNSLSSLREQLTQDQQISSSTLQKLPQFHLISWCGNFVERNSFRIVSGDSPEATRKLFLSTKLPHLEIRWNYGIFSNGSLSIKTSIKIISYVCTFQKTVFTLILKSVPVTQNFQYQYQILNVIMIFWIQIWKPRRKTKTSLNLMKIKNINVRL